MEENLQQRIVILGAGLAGLACAARLTELGYEDITVLEKEPHAGGLAVSIDFKGHRSDLGPHRIHSEIDRVLDFLNEWVGGDLITTPRKSRMLHRNRFIKYPPGLKDAITHFGIINMTKFLFSWAATRIGRRIFPPDHRSFESVMEFSFGEALYREIIKPYAEKTWGIPASDISEEVAGARVSAGGLVEQARRLFFEEKRGRETSLKEFLYTRGGIQTLSDTLKNKCSEKGVKFLFNREVTGIEKMENDAWKITASRPDGRETEKEADACFSTIPLPDLVRFLSEHTDSDESLAAMAAVSELKYLAMILIFPRIKKPLIGPDSWLYFPDREIIFNRAYEAKNFDINLAPEKETMICLEVTAHREDETWNKPDDEIAGRALSDLVKTGLVSEDEIIDADTRRLTHAYPIYSANYRKRVETAFSFLREFPGLFTLGRQGLFHHNNMDHSIYEGLLAADYLHEKERPAAAWYDDSGQFRKLRIVD